MVILKNKIEKIKSHESKKYEFIRFAIVGFLCTGIHYAIYLLLRIYIEVNIAYSTGYFLAFVLNYLLTNSFTFRTKPSIKKGVGFSISHVINYFLHLLLLNLFLKLGVKETLVPIPVFIIVIPLNFIILRFFFKKNSNQNQII